MWQSEGHAEKKRRYSRRNKTAEQMLEENRKEVAVEVTVKDLARKKYKVLVDSKTLE